MSKEETGDGFRGFAPGDKTTYPAGSPGGDVFWVVIRVGDAARVVPSRFRGEGRLWGNPEFNDHQVIAWARAEPPPVPERFRPGDVADDRANPPAPAGRDNEGVKP